MNFFVLASLFVLSVVAEPEAQYNFVKHANGAVTPEDTPEVQHVKAIHANAHATAYVNGYKQPLVYKTPLVYAHHQPVVYNTPVVYKAPEMKEKEPVEVAKPVVYTHHQPIVYQQPHVYAHQPVAYAHQPVVYTHPTTHHVVAKREAEAEADPQFYTHGGVYTYPYTYGAVSPVTYTYPTTYNYAAYPYVSTYGAPVTSYATHHVVAKRDAEADPQYFYNSYYGYRAPYYNRYYGYAPYRYGYYF